MRVVGSPPFLRFLAPVHITGWQQPVISITTALLILPNTQEESSP